jgi:thioredoxin reductase
MSCRIIIYSAILYMEEIKNSSNNTWNVIKATHIDNNNIIDEKRKENEDNQNNIFDVAIVGAGFAGLSAALLLGRYLRPTVIFDGGKTRNSSTKHVHGYLGFENASPKQFIQKAWKDVHQYGSIKLVKKRVETVERSDQLFLLGTRGGSARRTSVKAKYIIIATGIEDVKPNIKNFEKFDGNGAWHCPHCDGFQTINKKLAIITSEKNDDAIRYAKEFLGWTKNIRLFIQEELTEKERTEVNALGIEVIENDDVTEIIGNRKGLIKGVISRSKRTFDADVIFYHLKHKIQNKIAKQLGCKLDEGYVKVNAIQQTTVSKVYATGDIDTDRHYIVLAAASGALAAISIYEEMLKDAVGAVKKTGPNE